MYSPTLFLQSRYLIWNISIFAFELWYPGTRVTILSQFQIVPAPSSPIYFNMEHMSSTHPINQYPGYDRYAEMTHFVNHATKESFYTI